MREITTHKVNGCNESLKIEATDEPGAGGANHEYLVTITGPTADEDEGTKTRISFQNGPIKECGTNGLTQEVLLAIVADRLECFQAGQFVHPKNQEALDHVRAAMQSLKDRTLERVARGVEGTLVK